MITKRRLEQLMGRYAQIQTNLDTADNRGSVAAVNRFTAQQEEILETLWKEIENDSLNEVHSSHDSLRKELNQ